MNILFFSRLFYPHIGGVEKHVLEVSRLLIKKGYEITVVTEQDSPKTKLSEVFEGIRIFRIPELKDGKLKKFKVWMWLFRNYSLIKNADIVHCHDVFFWYLPFRFLFPFKKVFTTFHGYESYPLKTMDVMVRKISEKLSMGNICIGDFIRKWYGTKPTYVSYGGVSTVKNSKSETKNENSALFIGRLDEQTGILTYTEAVEIIKKKIPNFDFLIIGDGNLKDGISKKIKILNPLSNAFEYFEKYNFAFVSRYLSMLEAMAAKKLVFAVYDNPLKKDYLEITPFSKHIIISSSVSELVASINFYLINKSTANKKINDGYEWVKKQTWENVMRKYLLLWKR